MIVARAYILLQLLMGLLTLSGDRVVSLSVHYLHTVVIQYF